MRVSGLRMSVGQILCCERYVELKQFGRMFQATNRPHADSIELAVALGDDRNDIALLTLNDLLCYA